MKTLIKYKTLDYMYYNSEHTYRGYIFGLLVIIKINKEHYFSYRKKAIAFMQNMSLVSAIFKSMETVSVHEVLYRSQLTPRYNFQKAKTLYGNIKK